MKFTFQLRRVYYDCSKEDKYSFWHSFTNFSWQLQCDSLHCEEEKDNENNKHAVAIVFDSFDSNKVLGHVPFCLFHSIPSFQTITFVLLLLARMNRDISLRPEISVDYIFHGDNRVIEWFKKSLEKLD